MKSRTSWCCHREKNICTPKSCAASSEHDGGSLYRQFYKHLRILQDYVDEVLKNDAASHPEMLRPLHVMSDSDDEELDSNTFRGGNRDSGAIGIDAYSTTNGVVELARCLLESDVSQPSVAVSKVSGQPEKCAAEQCVAGIDTCEDRREAAGTTRERSGANGAVNGFNNAQILAGDFGGAGSMSVIKLGKPKSRGKLRQTTLQGFAKRSSQRYDVTVYPDNLKDTVRDVVQWANNTAPLKSVRTMLNAYPVLFDQPYMRERITRCSVDVVSRDAHQHNFVLPRDLVKKMRADLKESNENCRESLPLNLSNGKLKRSWSRLIQTRSHFPGNVTHFVLLLSLDFEVTNSDARM